VIGKNSEIHWVGPTLWGTVSYFHILVFTTLWMGNIWRQIILYNMNGTTNPITSPTSMAEIWVYIDSDYTSTINKAADNKLLVFVFLHIRRAEGKEDKTNNPVLKIYAFNDK